MKENRVDEDLAVRKGFNLKRVGVEELHHSGRAKVDNKAKAGSGKS